MTSNLSERDILALPMGGNDADAETIGQYLMLVAEKVFIDQEDFSGKRPFGNSSWIFEVYEALIQGGALEGALDENGYIEKCDTRDADAIIARLFRFLKFIDFSKLPS